MPRSILLGRAPGPGEPLWLPEDRWWALALLELEAGNCRDCGHPLAETTAAEHEFGWDASVVRCHACAAGARRVGAMQEDGTRPEGLQVSIYRRENRP
ncbi:hypothetical protein [Kitasatospora sp. NPDC001175]|uniref:hypothetical protein n=1 Tax=Kitasatospora sp. NPDC001175 TaxID=3157103 RepID=UPI003D054E80